MIRLLRYDDPLLKEIDGDPLISTCIESAARQCGLGIQYDFWGVFSNLLSRKPKGFILQKGFSIWATVLEKSAINEMIEFIQFRNSGWIELDETLASQWNYLGEQLTVMSLNPKTDITLPDIQYTTDCPTKVAECNLLAGAINKDIFDQALVGLHLEKRRGIGTTVGIIDGRETVSVAAIIDKGHQYGHISYVATLPEYEGKGYGRAVVLYCAKLLLEGGRNPLVAVENHRISFYESFGWAPINSVFIFHDNENEC